VLAAMIALIMEAASTSESSVNFCQTTRRKNPEGSQSSSSTYKNYTASQPRRLIDNTR
jgi:hypothetical protein